MQNKLTFTIAVDHSDTIKPRHFGDADKFLIYEYDNREINFSDELVMRIKRMMKTTDTVPAKREKPL